MFEETLERLVVKSITSMEGSMHQAFETILEDAFAADTFDKVYDKIKEFFISDALKNLYSDKSEKDIIDELEILKPIAALYCCYFGMDYIYQKNTPQGEKLDFSYIKDFYDCSSNDASDIYNILRGLIGTLEKVKEFEDTLFINPVGYLIKAKKEGKDYFKSHIYLGNIKLYLDKACEIHNKNNKKDSILKDLDSSIEIHNKDDDYDLILKDLVPSITFIALRSLSSLPNGTYINRTKGYINVNAINTIDRWILGQDFIQKENLNINTFNINKVKYRTSPEIAKLINLAAADDVYRLDRLNSILLTFIRYIEEKKINENVNENDLAVASSLLLNIPLPMLPRYLQYLEKLFQGIEYKDKNIIMAMSKEIFRFTSVTFPYLIGLLCYLLFYRSYKPTSIEEIKEAVGKLEHYLQKNNEKLLHSFKINHNRIWLYGETENAKKYISKEVTKKGKYTIEWRKKHEKPLSEVIEIILSPKINNLKISTLISKNFFAYPTELKQQYMKFWYYGLLGIQLENKGEPPSLKSAKDVSTFFRCSGKALHIEQQGNYKIYKPEEYVLELIDLFFKKLS